MENVDGAIKLAEGISDFGMMAICAAFFIVVSVFMMIMFIKWFKDIIDRIMSTNDGTLKELKKQMEENNDIMKSVAEGLKPETLLRVKTTSSMAFDLSRFRLLNIIDTVRTENHIIERQQTETKIAKLVLNLYEDINSKLDYYTYRGRKLSSYSNKEWKEWMISAVIAEIYSDNPNEDRMNTDITAVFDRVKIDFYHRLTEL